ncbi:site-specific DNA-methyltransferase [Thalassoglobus sp. JC818]|uniref:site-specific DNA-methyltransferase n=1 Tax=Thalassoglobus sp. JC818 TaxID=3232136 RepID=UPI0034586F64
MNNFEKLQKLLEELFQLDQADLDFGIYRIMNQKRDEVVRFLEKDLLPQVKEAFSHYQSADKATLQKELDKLVTQIEGAGMNPDESPKVQEIKQQMADSSVDVTALENEVFSHLFNFFRRYYHEGDFISLRRYKEGVYAIPYEGEEVKLHWANHDQYYVKSSEYFRDYIFTMPSGKRVRVHLVAASSEQDNKKEQTGKERRFVICEEDPIYEENGELYIRFEYKSDNGKKKQDALNQEAIERVLKSEGFEEWTQELSKPAPTKANPKRTVLEKHLTQYTARNTFDYFIHKDLGGFLRRELDFYIKNEVMHLDDIEHDTVPRVEQYLSKIKVIRKIAHKIIQFLEQLENFQKKLWLKKKFVVETNYCITLDRVPEELYPEIAANDAQREEWVRLFAIDKIEKDLNQPGFSEPLQTSFLKAHPHLSIDTQHFSASFYHDLLRNIDDMQCINGALIHSENFHALIQMRQRYHSQVQFIYIDPPYNTGDDSFLYKDNYQHSSWISLLRDRLELSRKLLADNGSIAISIDHEELGTLRTLLDEVFGRDNLISVITIKRGSVTGHKAINPGVVNISEYVLFFAKNRSAWIGNNVYSERDRDPRYGMFIQNVDEEQAKWTFCPLLEEVARFHGVKRDKLKDKFGDDLESVVVQFVGEHGESVVRLADVNISGVGQDFQEAVKASRSQPDEVVLHCREEFPDVYLLNGQRVLFYKNKLKQIGDRRVTVEKASDIWVDVLPNDLHNEGGVSLKKGKKPEALVGRLIEMATDEDDVVLDFFCGSGTAAAVAQKMRRRWLAVDCADYFSDKTVGRLKHVLFGEQRGVSKAFAWKGGGAISVLRMESYDDALNSLEMSRTNQQSSLLEEDDDLREQYILSYMLDVESRGSQSLLNVESFRNPDEYKLRVERNGETQLVNVDLVETFNWLLGLSVKHIDVIRGVRVVEGTNPEGDRALVLWRNLDEIDNDALDEWFKKQDYNTKDQEYDLIYANGDNNLENLRRGDQTWKVRLIEEEFGRLMFDVSDI